MSCRFMLIRARRVVCPVVGAMLLVAGAACSHTKLDDSFGIRNREIFRVQNAPRTPREIVNSGQEAESAVLKHYSSLAPSESGGASAPPASPVKIPGLSH